MLFVLMVLQFSLLLFIVRSLLFILDLVSISEISGTTIVIRRRSVVRTLMMMQITWTV